MVGYLNCVFDKIEFFFMGCGWVEVGGLRGEIGRGRKYGRVLVKNFEGGGWRD